MDDFLFSEESLEENNVGTEEAEYWHILVVDDAKITRELTSKFLKNIEVNHDVAKGGEEALKLLKKAHKDGTPFDAAIIDYRMPNMNGVELAQKIKKSKALKSTKLILTSTLENL
ncbi:response regulator, partial [uncultured Pseudoalteromonas sp.]|uniref:response regulator n=1 Tax=uncultured Pseudoalteromonas sp. TaxID=114053 RepID=UPI002620AA8B